MANIIDAILRLTDNFTPTLVKAQDGLTKYSRQAQRIRGCENGYNWTMKWFNGWNGLIRDDRYCGRNSQ